MQIKISPMHHNHPVKAYNPLLRGVVYLINSCGYGVGIEGSGDVGESMLLGTTCTLQHSTIKPLHGTIY